MVVVNRPDDEKVEAELQSLADEFQELKARMSDLRKNGKDTRIAELMALDFTPRLRMAKVTYESKDINKIKQLLQDITTELKEAEEGSEFDHAMELIREAYEYIREGKLMEASVAYSAIVRLYKKMPGDLKRTLYLAGLDIKAKLEKAEKG